MRRYNIVQDEDQQANADNLCENNTKEFKTHFLFFFKKKEIKISNSPLIDLINQNKLLIMCG